MTPRMLTLLRFLLVAEWDRRIIGCGRNGIPLHYRVAVALPGGEAARYLLTDTQADRPFLCAGISCYPICFREKP
jgi:hypothetical protein